MRDHAAFLIDEDCCRQTGDEPFTPKRLEGFALAVLIKGQMAHPVVFEPLRDFFGISRVHIEREHLKTFPARFGL